MARRRGMDMAGEPVRLAPPEYVILRKLEYFREGGSEKHLRDIAGMLRVSGDSVDRAAVEEWSRRLGVMTEWEAAQKRAEA